MILLIDAGNSRIKWALATPAAADAGVDESAGTFDMSGASGRAGVHGRWQCAGAVARADWARLPAQWQAAGMTSPPVRVLASNVAGPALRRQLDGLPALPAIEWLVSQAGLGGLQNGYRNPAQLGCDRFASSIGARALFPRQSLIVATCGTATTIDAIDPSGRFTGGMILPGLALMSGALALNTAQLPQIPLIRAGDPAYGAAAGPGSGYAHASIPFADNTEQAIAAGCVAAQIGAIDMAVRQQRQAFPDTRCLLTGGAADYLAPYLALPHERFDNLVLIGLQVLAAAGPLQP